jgi:hypothetical protein
MARKSELKEQIKTNQQTINSLVQQNDLLMVAGNEQREMLAEIRQERDLYAKAFQTAAGRLAPHLGVAPDELSTFANELLRSVVLDREA